MHRHPSLAVCLAVLALAPLCLAAAGPLGAATIPCDAEQPEPLLPADPVRCAELADTVRHPSALPLADYEAALGDFLRNFCHRDEAAGWRRDKGVRDTGPYIATLVDGVWQGSYNGTHAPVVIWYSPEMIDWMRVNRPPDESAAPAEPPPVPDGAVMVKEMYPKPAAACAGVEPVERLLPTSGAAVMVRDRQASHDGWFWGWFGWSGWDPDWPAGPSNRLAYMGFGQYCVNCHASAVGELTFASMRNVEGAPGEPLVFLSQHFFAVEPKPSHHRLVTVSEDDSVPLDAAHSGYDPAFTAVFGAVPLPKPSQRTVSRMASETYDNVWVGAGTPTAAATFVTSDQCLGCHDAGSTGLQYDMTAPAPDGETLDNLSPYATWRSSPMGLGGRDPIFFAQLASETGTFHPDSSAFVQDVCLGCHGVMGQRQLKIDHGAGAVAGAAAGSEDCPPLLRQMVDAVPWPADAPGAELARYGALARDGLSCAACHRMLVGEGEGPALELPENRCVAERQALLNPGASGFARTLTGSFLVGPPGEILGPFTEPQTVPMDTSLGMLPVHSEAVRSSELCGSCHTVHLPVMRDGETLDHTYEQTTYPEWAFSAYRTGTTPQGTLPGGAGRLAQSCQSCHMPSREADGTPTRSKIASIQERSNFPQAEYAHGPEDIDLEVRDGFARHTLVGLNVFLVEMAQQFPDVLGIRTQDPMLVSFGVDPLALTQRAMLDQAATDTAGVAIGGVVREGGTLRIPVGVENRVGHKFPSGVGFRRAFLELEVLDAAGEVLWASGRTDGAGVIVDQDGSPIAGELWWTDDCSGPRSSYRQGGYAYQPHYQVVRRQDQAQIYQELVTAPGDGPEPECGPGAEPEGPLTTSFLSICGHLKDNRILPAGFLPLEERVAIAEALGAGADLAIDSGALGVGDDPDYLDGGGDALVYEVAEAELGGEPASVRATLYYQAIPPFYLQDRFCTSDSADTGRLYFLAGHLDTSKAGAADWKLQVAAEANAPVPGNAGTALSIVVWMAAAMALYVVAAGLALVFFRKLPGGRRPTGAAAVGG
jgi:hypothetical protein